MLLLSTEPPEQYGLMRFLQLTLALQRSPHTVLRLLAEPLYSPGTSCVRANPAIVSSLSIVCLLQANTAMPPPWHILYMCIAMQRLPFCVILVISSSRPEVTAFQFLSLSSSNLSTTVLPKPSRMASLASQTWMTLAVSTAFEACQTIICSNYF